MDCSQVSTREGALTVVAGVCPTDSWRILPSLTSGLELVCTGSPCGCCVSRHGFEVKSQLTDVVRHLIYLGGAGPGGGGRVAAGVSRVPDVGVVGGDRGTTGGGRDHTADTEPSSAAPTGGPRPAGALRGGVAGPCRRGGAGAGAVVIGELDHAEQRELL